MDEELKLYKSLRAFKESDVKRVIKTVVDELHEAQPEKLKEAIKQMVTAVTLDSTTFKASFTWSLPSISGVKLASPRGFRRPYFSALKPAFDCQYWSKISTEISTNLVVESVSKYSRKRQFY